MESFTTITRRSEDGEKRVALQMSEKEFEQITEKYSQGTESFRKHTPYDERITSAREKTKEELKLENFGSVDTEGFEKAVVMIAGWAEMVLQELRREKNFRIEITYNAEELKTDFCIYTTPKESESNDMMQENQED